MAVIGSYAVVKGEISEKLAIRYSAWLRPKKPAARLAPPKAARGLDNPRWDFSPKEETDRIPIRNWQYAVLRIIGKWWEELCWLFAVMTVWGIVRQRYIRGLCPDRDPNDGEVERRLLLVFAAVYGLALVRHSALLGYLSGRHIMALVYASVPWAAAGSFVCARGIAVKRRWSPRFARNAGIAAASLLVAASIVVQMQPNHLNHLSRWGHWSAGQWLAGNADPAEMVLDTRGWARFVSGQPGYDYWHVRQALTDSHLSYIIVGLDELEAQSSRARTLQGPSGLLGDSAQGISRLPRRSNGRRSTLSLSPSRHLGRTGPVSYGSLWQRWFSRGELDLDQRAVSRAPARRSGCERHDAREPGSVPRQARPIDGAGGSGQGGPAAGGLSQAAFPAPLARAAGRARRPGAASIRPPRRNGPISSAPGRWGSTCPKSSPRANSIGPWAHLHSFVMIAELSGCEAVNEAAATTGRPSSMPGLSRP